MSTIHAIFENGVFKPTEPVELPDHCEVEFEPRITVASLRKSKEKETAQLAPKLAKVYTILGRRHDGGPVDGAARHNEHQP